MFEPRSGEDGKLIGYGDRSGSGKECISAPRGINGGALEVRKKLSRLHFRMFMAEQPSAVVVMEDWWQRPLLEPGDGQARP